MISAATADDTAVTMAYSESFDITFMFSVFFYTQRVCYVLCDAGLFRYN